MVGSAPKRRHLNKFTDFSKVPDLDSTGKVKGFEAKLKTVIDCIEKEGSSSTRTFDIQIPLEYVSDEYQREPFVIKNIDDAWRMLNEKGKIQYPRVNPDIY
jgi:hypothetical protein